MVLELQTFSKTARISATILSQITSFGSHFSCNHNHPHLMFFLVFFLKTKIIFLIVTDIFFMSTFIILSDNSCSKCIFRESLSISALFPWPNGFILWRWIAYIFKLFFQKTPWRYLLLSALYSYVQEVALILITHRSSVKRTMVHKTK